MPAIDPSSLAGALPTEWAVGPLEGTPDSGRFASELGKQIGALADLQAEGAAASQALATGTATDPAGVVMAVERARLSMQLASQLRTKGVEAVNEIFRTQV
ncbi:MAG TPA: flagellar hook-basal body complex protein FliE [Solirubrobacteraceae bacterium]|jgi:flagellar hook-basal body complex protein FliE|nr:flagellar hook-basal body complex protein FliE [Solirubrobacteraceae bacterium]